MLLHYDIRITGKVHGVFFRATARNEADRLELQGFARNEEDGSVHIEIEGPRDNLDEFLTWCRKGPPHALVDSVKATTGEVQGFRGFHVR
jgi:acylphosphatase